MPVRATNQSIIIRRPLAHSQLPEFGERVRTSHIRKQASAAEYRRLLCKLIRPTETAEPSSDGRNAPFTVISNWCLIVHRASERRGHASDA